ncbi:MAG: indole-3-glycerol phosphate synthase TrpC [Nitrospinota bacterium]
MTLSTSTILDELVAGVREELEAAKRALSLAELGKRVASAPPVRGLLPALRGPGAPRGKVRVVAEVKRASPSQGTIASENFDPVAIARRYAEGGAAAISVLTERRRFGGSLGHLRAVREAVELPVLRKDFLFDPYQLYEARAAGADAVLLIAPILDGEELRKLLLEARALGMESLVEVHTEEELERALGAGARLLGINNRNLRTFETDPAHTLRLLARIPPERRSALVLVSESGLNGWREVEPLWRAGVEAILVGESLMRAEDPAALLRELRGLGGG